MTRSMAMVERVVDVIRQAEPAPQLEIDEAVHRRPQRSHERDHRHRVDAHLGQDRPDDRDGLVQGGGQLGVLVGTGCWQERVVQAGVAMGERSQLARDRSERIGRLEPLDAGGDLGGEQPGGVEGQLAAKPGEAVDVAVQRRGSDPEARRERGETQRAEAVPIGDLGGGSHDLLACQTELASHQRAVTDSALAFTATFIASNPALVLLSSDERMKRTSSPSNDSLCVSRVPAPDASSSKR